MKAAVAVLLAAALAAAPARASEMVTEVLPAGFRSADELAAILRPLVPPPGSVNGFGNQLVIKTTPANMEEIKGVLASLDRAPANLLVTVRRTLDSEVRRDLAQAAARVRAGDLSVSAGGVTGGPGASARIGSGEVTAGARVQHGTSTHRAGDVQSVRVLEGREAFIHTGESVPVGERSVVITSAGVSVAEGVRYQEFGSGFYVRPRLNGDRVTLEVIPSRRVLRGDGSAQVQEASTAVSGTLGRWMEIGGVDSESTRTASRLGGSRTVTTMRRDALYVKVERLD